MRYHFKITKDEERNFIGDCVELDKCFSYGETKEELIENLTEALEGVLLVNLGNNFAHPLPDQALDNNKDLLQVKVSEDVALTVMLRHYRVNKHLTQEAMGFKSRNSYVKLERGGNPTLKTLGRILNAFPDFPLNAVFA